MKLRNLAGGLAFVCSLAVSAQNHVMEVNTKKIGVPVQETMYGLFFEDINYAADGGLYGELVKNRSFEFPDPLMGWEAFGTFEVKADGPFKRCPHYVQLRWPGHKERRSGLSNNGFFGIGLQQGEDYRFSVLAKAPQGSAKIIVQFIDRATMEEHQEFAEAKLDITSGEWQKYEVVMKSPRRIAKAQLRIFLDGKNTVDLEHISLFPVNTFKNRKNGMRRDLAQALADEHPGLLRFPGGCIVEGVDLATRYQWKNTVGPVENRPLNENRWNYTFPHRLFPNYFQTYGMGFYELFCLSEYIGAEPLPILNVGLACQYHNDDKDAARVHVATSDLQPSIDDCLDLIEFCNGGTDTKWGKLRADMGHPAPFNLKFIGVGNEQWGPLYPERLEYFVKAIRAKYPQIKIVGSSGPEPDDKGGKQFTYGWNEMTRLKADLVDEHYYRNQQWFMENVSRYDKYDRKGPKVFAGEYACHITQPALPCPEGKNVFEGALYEAALMTGIERNADVVHMATYAPLFAHEEGWQWRPDLIWMDNLRTVRTPNYYVQQLYAMNPGSNVLSLTEQVKSGKKTKAQAVAGQDGLCASAVFDKTSGKYIVKFVNVGEQPQEVKLTFKGLKAVPAVEKATVTFFHSDDPMACNTMKNIAVAPSKEMSAANVVSAEKNVVTLQVPARTFAVFKF